MKIQKTTFRYKQNKLLPRKLCANKTTNTYIDPAQKGIDTYNVYYKRSKLLNKIGFFDLIDSTEHLLKRVADNSKANIVLKQYGRVLKSISNL